MSKVTLVTCYYQIKSKHSKSEYESWIKNLLANINVPVIIFTAKETVNLFRNYKNVHIVKKELTDLKLYQNYADIWDKQYKMDRWKNTGRTKECYIIWNSKFQFLLDAIEINPFNTDKFVWNDIGSVRKQQIIPLLKQYPLSHRVSDNKLDIVLLNEFKHTDKLFYCNDVHFSGSIFGGSKNLLKKAAERFYQCFDLYVTNNRFIGCDQQIIATMYTKYPRLFNCIKPKNFCDPWFYLYKHYTRPLKIALIGPGIIPIPPKSWGAVEILIWDYYNELRNQGVQVDIINPIRKSAADSNNTNSDYCQKLIKTVNSKDYDFVHLHYDCLYHIMSHLNCKKLAITTHYPYIDKIKRHQPDGYAKIFNFLVNSKNVYNFVIAEKDKNTFIKHGADDSKIKRIRNGISSSDFRFNPITKINRTIYLGKIDGRKLQYKYQNIDSIDFVGPLNCGSFNPKKNYLGTWTREQVHQNLTQYSNLLLISQGEADPLVVKEALISGLGVVINQTSAENLEKKKFITVIPDNKISDLEYLELKLTENREIANKMRKEIRQYGVTEFDISIQCKKYLEIICNIIL